MVNFFCLGLICVFCFAVILFLKEGLMQPRVALTSQSFCLSLQSWGSQRVTKPSFWQVPNEWVTSLTAAGCLRVTLLDSPSLCQSQFLYLLRIFSSK